jgi:hypothetical protein
MHISWRCFRSTLRVLVWCRYVGSLYVRLSFRPLELMGRINRLAGFSEDQPIKLFEEIKFDPDVMCEAIDKKITFKASQVSPTRILVHGGHALGEAARMHTTEF